MARFDDQLDLLFEGENLACFGRIGGLNLALKVAEPLAQRFQNGRHRLLRILGQLRCIRLEYPVGDILELGGELGLQVGALRGLRSKLVR